MFGGLGMWELLLIFFVILLLFGAKRLPEIGSGMGKAIRGFKDATSGKDAIDVTPKEGKGTEEKTEEQKS